MQIFIFALLLSTNLFAQADFIPEASGATKVGKTVVIAGDEEPKSLWLLNGEVLTKTSVKAKWDDMEGLATVDSKRFFATTSHGLTKKGKRKPEREQLFLMNLDQTITVEKTWTLRESILKFLESNHGSELNMDLVSTASPDDGGLNIEGLAYVGDRLYAGLRAPITSSGKGIILVFSNPLTAPKLTRSVLVDLGGKGIRSLEIHQGELLVLSGSTNDQQETFGLHKLELTNFSTSRFALPGFEVLIRPEGIVSEGTNLLFVQDFETPETQDIIQRISMP